jgi:hypothetical protein
MCGKFGLKCRHPRMPMIQSIPLPAAALFAFDPAYGL